MMRQKAVCLTLTLCLLMTLCPIAALGEPTQSDFNNATVIKTEKKYSGTINNSNPSRLYKFTLKKSGKVKISLNISSAYVRINGGYSGVELVADFYEDTAGKHTAAYYEIGYIESGIAKVMKESPRLIAGTYYLYIGPSDTEQYWMNRGEGTEFSCNLSFTLNYTADKESFKESLGKRNNNIKNANRIKLNKQYRGQFAENDQSDCYKFRLSKARRLHITFISSDSRMREITMSIKKPSGITVKKTSVVPYCWLPDYWEVSLKAGTYCLRVYNGWVYTGDEYDSYFAGTYKFKVCKYGAYSKATTYLEFGWPKRSWGNGYLAEVASDKKFTKNVRKQVVGRSETSTWFNDLPKGKTYYVRVRPYKKKKSKVPSWKWMKLKKSIKYKPWSKTLKVEL